MTNIKIHGQKIQFHKRIAISVSLVQPTPYGTLTYTPYPGQPGLGSLPIGAQILIESGRCYIRNGNDRIGELTSSASSGYELSSYTVWKNSGTTYNVTTTPITLEDSDGITAMLVPSTKQIQVYLGWDNQSYGDPWSYATLSYNGQYLNPNMQYIEMQSNRDKVQLEITSGGADASFKFYVNGGNETDVLDAFVAAAPSYKVSSIQYYDADTGTTYTCDGTSTVIGNVGDMGMARILLDIGMSCDLVYYSKAHIQHPSEITAMVQYALYQNYPSLVFQQLRSPNTFNYILYDGTNRYGICVAMCQVPGQNPGEMRNGEVVIPFFYDGYTMYSTPYDEFGFALGQLPYWSSTGYSIDPNLLDMIFYQGYTNALEQLEMQWSAPDVCSLGTIIYSLATNK